MKMLSQVIANAYCPAAQPKAPDRFFAVGCQAVGSSWMPADPAEAARVSSQATAIMATKHRPWEPDGIVEGVFNDLFSPFREVDGSRLVIWIPVPIEEALTSSMLARDWRIVALAWWAISRQGGEGSVVVVAFDASNRTISCDFRRADLMAAMEIVIQDSGAPFRKAGVACRTCTLTEGCQELRTYSDAIIPPAAATDDPALRAFRLFNERVEASLRLERLEERREAIDAELAKLVRDGRLKLGPEDELVLPARTTTSWDFASVRRLLMSQGLWDDIFGSIRSAELLRAIVNFPADVKKELEKARIEKTIQPSISEAARHGRFAVGPAFLGGVSIQGKGGLGRS